MNDYHDALKHPKILWGLSLVYGLFFAAFGSILATLTLYLIHTGMPTGQTYTTYAVYGSLLFTLPVLGGYLSGRYSHKLATGLGILACAVGVLLMCFHNFTLVLYGLSLFLVGNSLFTPGLWCLVDHIYRKTDKHREIGYTWFYLFFNVFGIAGMFVGGWLSQHVSYEANFSMDVICLMLSFLVYLFVAKRYQAHPDRGLHHESKSNAFKRALVIVVYCVVFAPVAQALFEHPLVNNYAQYILAVVVFFAMLWLASKQPTREGKIKVFGFLALVVFAIGFWALYNLEPSLLSVFISKNVTQTFMGVHVPPQSFLAFEPVFVVLTGLAASRIWMGMNKRNKEMGLTAKFSLALVLIGAAFVYLMAMIYASGVSTHLPFVLMFFTYFFLAAGEILIGPIGISMVGKLAPEGKEGLFMGVWELYIGMSAVLAGILANVAVIPKHTALVHSNASYAHLFGAVGGVAMGIGIIALVISLSSKTLRRI